MAWNSDDDSQLAFLLLPPGERDSGRARYAAAMHFNRSHRLSHAALEVFRILAKEDEVNPRDLLAGRGLAHELDALTHGPRS